MKEKEKQGASHEEANADRSAQEREHMQRGNDSKSADESTHKKMINRARKSFNNDGPGGSYSGY